jgi:5'-deoxynucleotidase YfbR-like HD superfamily hydrolase
MNELLSFLSQVGRLKDLPRAGWVRKGIPDPESVADHSFRTAVLALALAKEMGVDPDRLLRLVIVHDLPESDPDVGDITPFCGVDRDEKRRRERAAMERLCAGMPELLACWLEYDEGNTPEAQAAHELDALEMALQAREYEARHGVDLSEFRASARAKVRHPALIRLLDELG